MTSIYYNTITNSFRLVEIYNDNYIFVETMYDDYLYKYEDALVTFSNYNHVLIGYL